MLGIIVQVAVSNGHAVIVEHGKVPMEYAERANNALDDAQDEMEDGKVDDFHSVWKEIAELIDFKHDVDECLLSVNNHTGVVSEVIIVNQELYEELEGDKIGIRLLSDIV